MEPEELCVLKPALVKAAKARSDKMGTLRNSFMSGKGNVAGFAAELGFVAWLKYKGVASKFTDDYNYDVLAGEVAQLKLELKCKTTTVAPRKHYSNSVCNHNTRQKADDYLFLRIQWHDKAVPEKGGVLYYCGSMPCKQFRTDAKFFRKGALDPDNNYVCKNDCWSLPIASCLPLSALMKRLKP